MPLGNITSQLFANIYLNELDQFMKHELREKYYLRYCDDFIILGEGKKHLEDLISGVDNFLQEKIRLDLHPDKISIRKFRQGLDFLGYVVLPHHRVLRTKTERRIIKKIKIKKVEFENKIISEESFSQSAQSYLGILKHCNGRSIEEEIIKTIKK